jgi:hypothetical protein
MVGEFKKRQAGGGASTNLLDAARAQPIFAAAITRLFISPGLVGTAAIAAAWALGAPLRWEVTPSALSIALEAAAVLTALDALVLLPDWKVKVKDGEADTTPLDGSAAGPSDAALARSLAAVSDLSALTGGGGLKEGGGRGGAPTTTPPSTPPPLLQPEERAALLKALAAGRAAALEAMAARGGVMVGLDPSVGGGPGGLLSASSPSDLSTSLPFRARSALNAFASVLSGGSGRLRPPPLADLAIVSAGRAGTEAARAVLLTVLGRWAADRVVEAGPDAVDAASAWAVAALPLDAASLAGAAEAGVAVLLSGAVAGFGLAGVLRGAPVGEPSPRAQAASVMAAQEGRGDGTGGAAGPAMLAAVARSQRQAAVAGGGGEPPSPAPPSSSPPPQKQSAAAMAIALTTRLARAQADAGGVQAFYQGARLAALSAAFVLSGGNLFASTAAAIGSAGPITFFRGVRRDRATAARTAAAAAFKAALDAPDIRAIRAKLRGKMEGGGQEVEDGGVVKDGEGGEEKEEEGV